MPNRLAVHTFWRAALNGLARLNQILSCAEPGDDSVFQAPPRRPERTYDAERRMAEARKARIGN